MKNKIFLLVVFLLVSLPCFSADTFQVSSSVFKSGELVESSVMEVEADKKAYMTIGEDFRYELTVSPKQDEVVEVKTAVEIGDHVITPTLTVFYGKEALVEIGETKLTVLVNKFER